MVRTFHSSVGRCRPPVCHDEVAWAPMKMKFLSSRLYDISPADTMAIGSGYVPQAGPATAPSVGVNSDVSTVLTAAQQELVNHIARRNALNFIRPGHVSVHSFRKGPATEVSTSPESSLPSIFHRGEWSLGVVQDIYFKFAEKGDHVIGRILGGLDPDSADFDVLPPHWTVPDDEHIKEAMELCFGNILSPQ